MQIEWFESNSVLQEMNQDLSITCIVENSIDTWRFGSHDDNGWTTCFKVSPAASQVSVLDINWMMYKLGLVPSSLKYIESPSFENDSVAAKASVNEQERTS